MHLTIVQWSNFFWNTENNNNDSDRRFGSIRKINKAIELKLYLHTHKPHAPPPSSLVSSFNARANLSTTHPHMDSQIQGHQSGVVSSFQLLRVLMWREVSPKLRSASQSSNLIRAECCTVIMNLSRDQYVVNFRSWHIVTFLIKTRSQQNN